MPKNQHNESSLNNSRGSFTSSSGNELIPIIKKKNQLLIDAQMLHERLGVKVKFQDWIKRRINEFKLEKDIDFFISSFSNLRTKLKNDYAFTIRVAEMIAMFERNEIGREIRKQLIRQETSYLFNSPSSLRGIDNYEHNGKKMYKYADVLTLLGYQKGGSNYKTRERYPNDFANVEGTILVSEQYAIVMSHRRIARNLLVEIKARQLSIPFEKEVDNG